VCTAQVAVLNAARKILLYLAFTFAGQVLSDGR